MLIYRDSIKSWAPPDEVEPVSEEARQRIVDNIRAALGSHGIDVDVI
jgi:hypothetical protein